MEKKWDKSRAFVPPASFPSTPHDPFTSLTPAPSPRSEWTWWSEQGQGWACGYRQT